MNSYPRETREFIPVTITVNDVITTVNVKFAVVERNARPSVWVDSLILDGKTGVLIDGLAVGYFNIWAQITDNPEIPVIDCGTIRIT